MKAYLNRTKIILLLCFSILCYAAFYLGNIHLLHHLSEDGYGDFIVSIRVLLIITALLSVTKQISYTLYSPQLERTHKYIQKTGILLWLGKGLLLSASIFIIGSLLTYGVIIISQNQTFISVFADHPLHYIMFFMPIVAFVVVLTSLILSQNNLNTYLVSLFTIVPSLLIIAIFILAMHISNLKPQPILLTYAACQICIMIIYLVISKYYNSPRLAQSHSTSEHDLWYAKSRSFWISSVGYQISLALSLLALELLSSEEAVGRYATILLFSASYYAIISPLHTYLSSQLDSLLESNSKQIEAILAYMNRIQFLIVVIIVTTTIAYGYQILLQIGPQYTSLHEQLTLCMTLFGIAIILSPSIRILLHSSHQQYASHLRILQITTTAALLVTLVPLYGVTGAIIADTLPMIFVHGWAGVVCYKRLGINPLIL